LPAGPVTIQLDRTKRILAAEIGTVSETLSRTLAKLRGQKLVRVEGKAIIVVSPREMQRTLERLLLEG
jgi:CRP/FNR family transcriptional regulator